MRWPSARRTTLRTDRNPPEPAPAQRTSRGRRGPRPRAPGRTRRATAAEPCRPRRRPGAEPFAASDAATNRAAPPPGRRRRPRHHGAPRRGRANPSRTRSRARGPHRPGHARRGHARHSNSAPSTADRRVHRPEQRRAIDVASRSDHLPHAERVVADDDLRFVCVVAEDRAANACEECGFSVVSHGLGAIRRRLRTAGGCDGRDGSADRSDHQFHTRDQSTHR